MNYGLVPDVQLHTILPLTLYVPADGASSYGYGVTELGVKCRFVHEGAWRPQIGIFPLLEVPPGPHDVQPGEQPVARGAYSSIRHPNYLAIVLEIIAIPMIQGAWITAVLFSVGSLPLLAVRISVEENALGESYAQAFASRPRFIPKLPH